MPGGKTALVTGAACGIGAAIATRLANDGWRVVLVDRDAAKTVGRFEQADVSREDDVIRTVNTIREREGRLDALVCNAGIFGAKGAIDEVDWDEWVSAVETNLLGTVMCVRRALPLLRRSAFRAKIAITAGGGAERAHPYLSAYGASKAGLVRFGECLALQLADWADVNLFLPGRLVTRMADEVIAAGPERVGRSYYDDFVELRRSGGASADNAAALAVFLGSAGSDGIHGRLIHAVRDDWRALPERRPQLEGTDVYTLRRIDPKDRGFRW